MTLDIREGDTLVYGGKEYPVRAVGDWEWHGPVSLAMQRMLTRTCSFKRPPAVSGAGKRGEAVAVAGLTDVPCFPLDPADPAWRAEVMARDPRLDSLKAYAQMLETTILDGVGRFVRLMVEEVKQHNP